VAFAIIVGLFALGVAFIGISPALNYLYNNNWELLLSWMSVILLVWAPIVGIITFFVRRITKAKRNSSIVRITFIALTIIGFISLAFALVSLKNNFRYKGTAAVDSVRLENASVDKLEVKLSGYGGRSKDLHWFKIEPFEGIDDDTIFVPNTDVRIIRATGKEFKVTILRASNGKSKVAATDLANKILYSITQKDTVLSLYKGIPINTTDKFRNQRVIITIAVPVGKRIKIDDAIGWRTHFDVKINGEIDWKDEYTTDDNLDWDANREYVMTEKGLVLTGNDAKKYKNGDKDEDLKERLDELKQDIEEKQRDMDEKKKELQDQIDEQQRDLDEKKRQLKQNSDSTNQKAKIQKTVAAPKLMPKAKENDIEETPSIMNTI